MPLAIANRYARALVDVVLDPSSGVEPAQAVSQLRALEDVLSASSDLPAVLLSPAVPPARKRAVVSRLAAQLGVSTLVQNFLFVVIDRRRIAMLKDIRQAFETLLDERVGVVRADVSSARELASAQREKIRQQLARATGKQVRCEFAVDGDLVGGVVVRVGSTIYDGSVRGQLEALRQRLVR